MANGNVTRLEPSLPRAAYCDPPFFARESDAIFLGEWFCAGRIDAFAAPGQYRVVEIGGESIIIVRGDDGLHAHVNLCRHRGSRLLCGSGTARGAIRCPYHAWAYAYDGTTIATPFVERDELPDRARRLHSVAIDTWGGFVFVRVKPPEQGGAPLPATLGDVPRRVARYPLESLQTAAVLRYDVRANWKVVLENYNECYHCAGVHPELCRLVPAFKERGGSHLDWERGIAHREGAYTFTVTGTTSRARFAGLNADERERHKGELIYPNLMLSLSADHVAAFTLWPRGTDRTEIECAFLFDPDETAKPAFDPSDAVAFWDVVNRQDWTICESVQDGMRSRFFTHGYYAPMEDASLDIRRYVAEHLGEDAVRVDE